MIRLSKILLIVFVGLQGLFYALNNVVNFEAAKGFVQGVLPMAGNEAYPNAFGPAVSSPVLITIVLCCIIVGEFVVAAFSFRGAYDMFRVRGSSAESFHDAKTWAIMGCVMALLVWFGLFMVIGGAYFQMWQTPLGAAAQGGAFQYAISSGIVLLFVNAPD
jgi:predicted small integral membrane protein